MAVYSISNKDISVSVNTLGAELISFRSGEMELMWQSDSNVWARYAPVLFPVVGRLKEDQYIYKDSSYKMSQHGFARDKEFILIENAKDALEFELTANEQSLEMFPFHFSLRIRYELKDKELKIAYRIFNPDNKPLLFSIGAHPGFNCKRVKGETLDDFYLEIPGKETLIAEKLETGLQSGKTYEVQVPGGKLKLSSALFDNDALVFKNTQVEKVILSSGRSPIKLSLECKSWPYFGVWSKKGSDAFVCLEPWYGIADNINANGNIENKEGIIRLEPYMSFECHYTFHVSTD